MKNANPLYRLLLAYGKRDRGKEGGWVNGSVSGDLRNKSKHCGFMVRIHKSNGEAENTLHATDEHKPPLLRRDTFRMSVDDVRDNPTGGSEENIEKTKHGSPPSGFRLPEVRKVLHVESSQNRINRQLPAERASIWCREHETLQREDDLHSLLESGSLNDFALSDGFQVYACVTAGVLRITVFLVLLGV